jgi:hypothetical protein
VKIERHNLGFKITTPGDSLRHRAICRDVPGVLAVVAHYYGHPHDKSVCEFCRQIRAETEVREQKARRARR